MVQKSRAPHANKVVEPTRYAHGSPLAFGVREIRMRIATLPLVLALFVSSLCLADPGSPIPKPKQSATQAIEIVQALFLKAHPDSDTLKYSDFIVVKLEYARLFDDKAFAEWGWFVTLRHPVQNDVSFTYRLDPKGEVTLIQETV